MVAVEFQTFLQNGTIKIPEKLSEKLSGQVRVIILKEERADEPYDILTELMNNPIQDPDFVPFKRDEIYDRKS